MKIGMRKEKGRFRGWGKGVRKKGEESEIEGRRLRKTGTVMTKRERQE
jgi:hypothetical protein